MISAPVVLPMQSFLELRNVSFDVRILLLVALCTSSVGGLVVAAILKKLDNIVKEYSSATANMFTAIVCSFLFPEKFTFTVFILLAMVLLFLGIYLYETMKNVYVVSVNSSVIEGVTVKT